MKNREFKYAYRRPDTISENLRFDTLLISNIGKISKDSKMGISTGYSKSNAESSEIYNPGTPELLSKGDVGKSKCGTGNHPLFNSLIKRYEIYQSSQVWNILYQTGRNRENIWRLCQKIGYILFRAAKRGGNWNNTSDAGVFTLNLNNTPSNRNNNIGFRASLILYYVRMIFFTEYIRARLVPRIYILVSYLIELAKNMNRWVVISRENRASQSIALEII